LFPLKPFAFGLRGGYVWRYQEGVLVMARVDDYKQSFELAAQELAGRNWLDVARRAGAEHHEDHLALEYYGRPVRVGKDPVTVVAQDEGSEIPLAEQALILHYLVNADGSEPEGQWVTFREMPSGEFYWSAFVKRAKDPLVGFFSSRPKLLLELAPLVGGRPVEDVPGDAAVAVRAFPRVEFVLQLWEGDEEFPPEGNILMDPVTSHYLSTEDIALAAGLPIYKMMALARQRG
jgi:hypothetical protein